MLKKHPVVAVVCLSALLVAIPASAQAQALVIEGGTLINGNGGPPIQNAVVVIEGSRIKAAGAKGKVSIPANARVIKEDGKFILPGLFDVDVHYREWNPQMFLHYGVTSAYESSNQNEWIIAQRDMINHGKFKGPRLFVSGLAITGPIELSRANSGPESSGAIIHVNTVEEAREAVRKQAAAGVDIIHTEEALTPELLKAVVEEAKKQHRPVLGHSRDIRAATMVGMKYMEHSVPLAHSIFQAEDPKKVDEVDWAHVEFPGVEYRMNSSYYAPLIKLMVDNGVFINPTFAQQWRSVNPRSDEWSAIAAEIAKEPGIEFAPADVRLTWTQPPRPPRLPVDQLTASFKKVQEFVHQYLQAGGKVLVGTDSLSLLGLQGIDVSFEMQSLVDAGATPMQAIMAATKYSAEAGYQDKELGTLEPGKLADVLIVDEDPLKDVAAVRKVALVIKGGEVIDRAYDPTFKNPIPRADLTRQLKGSENGPELSTISPRIEAEGAKDITLKVVGKRFSPQSVVRFDNADLKTQFVSDSQLTAVIPSASLQKVGTYVVAVANSDSGVKSNLRYFIVNFKY